MKPSTWIALGGLLASGLFLGGCDDGNTGQDELQQIRQEIMEVKKEIAKIRRDFKDMVPHLENLEEILKFTRREVGKNGDAIAGLRDHITLTVRSYATDGKGEKAGDLTLEDMEALKKRLDGLGVDLDMDARTLTLTGIVATPAGALEFACVAEAGKAHESLFMLRCEPRALNAGLLALGLEPGTAGKFVGGKPVRPEGPKVDLFASWTDQGKEVTHRVEDLIIDLRTQKPLVRCGFTYIGSRRKMNTVTGKRFYAADITRDLVAVWNSPNTVLDLATAEAAWDDAYVANRDKMPPKGTPVKVVVRLQEKSPEEKKE